MSYLLQTSKMMMKITTLILILLTFQSGMAQETFHKIDLIATIGVTGKSSLQPAAEAMPVNTKNLPAFQLGSDYRYLFSKHINFLAGLRLGLGGSSISTNYPVEDVNPAYLYKMMLLKIKEYVLTFSTPISIEYGFRLDKPISYYTQVGLKLNFSLMADVNQISYGFITPDGEEVIAFQQSAQLNNHRLPWVSLPFGAGLKWNTRNSGIIRTGILCDLSISKVASGTYSVVAPGREDTYGEFFNHLSTLSIQFAYSLKSKKDHKITPNSSSLISKDDITRHDDKNNRKEFNRTHIGIGINALFNFPAQVNTISGENLMSASAVPGIGFNGSLIFNLSRKYSIITGINASLHGRNFNLSMDKTRYTPNLQESVNLSGMKTMLTDFILNLPLGIERKWFTNKLNYITLEGGFGFNFYPGSGLEFQDVHAFDINNDPVKVASIIPITSEENRFFGSAFVNLGYNTVLKNHNVARIALISNFSFKDQVAGEFSIFDSSNTISNGTYSAGSSYFGLGFTYIYTRSRHR